MVRKSHLPWLVLVVILLTMLVSWRNDGIMARLLDTQLSGSERVLVLQHYFQEAGFFAPVAYVIFVITEVIVAPIPGLMLYAPGGLIFGPWLGGFLAIIGNTIGAGISGAKRGKCVAEENLNEHVDGQTSEVTQPSWLLDDPVSSSQSTDVH